MEKYCIKDHINDAESLRSAITILENDLKKLDEKSDNGLILQLNIKLGCLLTYKIKLAESIEKINDPTLTPLLRYRYICGYTWDEITEKMGYSRTHIFRMRKKALTALYGTLD